MADVPPPRELTPSQAIRLSDDPERAEAAARTAEAHRLVSAPVPAAPAPQPVLRHLPTPGAPISAAPPATPLPEPSAVATPPAPEPSAAVTPPATPETADTTAVTGNPAPVRPRWWQRLLPWRRTSRDAG